MKKLLLILLSLIMCLSVFTSCNTETDNSSDVSVSGDNDSSVEEPSTQPEGSAEASENVSEPEATVDLEKVIYFEGKYNFSRDLSITAKGSKEIFSNGGTKSLTHYLENGEYSKDSYFSVGLLLNGESEQCLKFLADNGFIVDKGSMFINSNNPLPENYGSMTAEEKKQEQLRIAKAKLPNVNIDSNKSLEYEAIPSFDTVGYITADALNALSENEAFGVEITWFPAPDNQELWLTGLEEPFLND